MFASNCVLYKLQTSLFTFTCMISIYIVKAIVCISLYILYIVVLSSEHSFQSFAPDISVLSGHSLHAASGPDCCYAVICCYDVLLAQRYKDNLLIPCCSRAAYIEWGEMMTTYLMWQNLLTIDLVSPCLWQCWQTENQFSKYSHSEHENIILFVHLLMEKHVYSFQYIDLFACLTYSPNEHVIMNTLCDEYPEKFMKTDSFISFSCTSQSTFIQWNNTRRLQNTSNWNIIASQQVAFSLWLLQHRSVVILQHVG